ncbi:hypothetical protein Pmani_001398 [Petrolisthes manimaculis]|uniref:HEAT repeat-containing protein 1 n=1 Tax=Petrolisthes manimaculis TaxID=1843537 RepID=A0AAE1UPG8_9EUCA|nr:hypothetical protein Pmani_001398 [Petrolisthes manimaculis]
MATSLALQLQRLETPQTSLLDQKRVRKSILFEPSDASNYGRDIYYDIGTSGFKELVETDNAFIKFRKTLFSKAAIDMQRAVQDKATNDKLDAVIDNFLVCLSPYLEKQAALKALEWLAYRFQICEMNRHGILLCILPYYESPVFVRVLQTLDLKGEQWEWLQGCQKSGRPVPKATVFTRWLHYQSFRSFVAELIRKSLKIHTIKAVAKLKIPAAFYVSTVVGGICLEKEVTEEHLSSIIPLIPECLSCTPDLIAGTYLILSLLATRTTLSKDSLDNILKFLTVKVEPSLEQQHVLLLLTLSHHQHLQPLPPKVFHALNTMDHLYRVLRQLAETKSVAPLLSALLSGVIGDNVLSSDEPLKNKESNLTHLTKLMGCIADFPLSHGDSADVIWSFLEMVRVKYDALPTQKLKQLLSMIEMNHPEGHSRAMTRLKRAESDPMKGKEYKKLFKLFVGGKKDTPTSFLHLVNPNDDIRQSAASTFLATLSNGQQKEESNNKLHMTSLLSDSCPNIVLAALTCSPGLKLLDPAIVVARCQTILRKEEGEQNTEWTKAHEACIQVLTGDLVNSYTQDLYTTVLHLCLPLVLFPNSRADFVLTKRILKSNLCQKEPLLSSLSRNCCKYLNDKSSTFHQYFDRVWYVMPRVIASLQPLQHRKLWARFTVPATTCIDNNLEEHIQLNQFMMIVLLSCALQETIETTLRLQLAHTLLDTCFNAFNTFSKVSDSHTAVDTKQTFTSDILRTWRSEVTTKGRISVSLLALSFQRSLSTFSLPKSCFTTPYWTIDSEGEGSEGELLLLVKAMRGAMLLDHHDKTGSNLRDQLLTSILKTCLTTTEQRFYFLSLLWGWDASLPYTHIIDDVLQLWSLKLGAALLTTQKSSLAWSLGTCQPLVPALLSSLTHTCTHIRRAALVCVSAMASIKGGRLSHNNHSLLLQTVLTRNEEIVADASQMATLLPSLQSQAKTKCEEVTKSLTDAAISPGLPHHLCSPLLYILTGVINTEVLKKLLPLGVTIVKQCVLVKEDSQLDQNASLCLYYILLGLTPDTSQILTLMQGWLFFVTAITCSKPVLKLQHDITSPQAIIIDQVMSGKFFSSLACEDVKGRVWGLLINRVVESGDPREAQQLRKGLRKVELDAQVVAKQIHQLQLNEKVTTIKAAKAKRLKQRKDESVEVVSWRQLGLMLETIGVMASLTHPWKLVAPLTQCLQTSLTLDFTIIDLTQQQILSALLHLLQKSLEELGEEELKKHVQLNTEVVVQCVRASHSPDTHRRAMLILAFAARIHPDAVIQKVMPIFTFMGTSLMWRDDSYSFQVIHQTIESIIPTLVKCESEEPLELRLGRVCQVFVDALPDVPQHRRLTLFTQLATTLDPARHLWIILALLADSHVLRGNVKEDVEEKRSDEKRKVPADIQFALTLAAHFPVVNQTTACISLMSYVSKLPQETENLGTNPSHHPRSHSDSKQKDIISWDLHSPKQTCHFKFTAMGLIALILASEEFVGQVCEASKEEEGELRGLYRQLMEQTMAYLHSISNLANQFKDKPEGRLVASVQRKVIEVVDGVNAVLPPRMLLEVVGNNKDGLLASPLPLVRCRATEILCAKLQPGTATFFSSEHYKSLLKLSTTLCTLSLKFDEPMENRQTYLMALQLVTRLLAPHTPLDKLQPVLATAVNIVCSEGDGESKLVTQALVLVTECVVALKAQTVTELARLMPTLTHLLNTTTRTHTSDNLLLQATVTATHKLVETIPQLLSPYLVGLVSGLCGLWSSKEESGRVAARVLAAREAIAVSVEARVLIPALKKAYNTLMKSEAVCVCGLMVMVEKLVTTADIRILTTYQKDLLSLFIQALNLRAEKSQYEKIDEVESSVFTTLSKLLLRLNQNQNVAIFLSIKSWAGEGSPAKQISFFRYADHLVGMFKILFLKAHLAEVILDAAPTILDHNNTLHTKQTMFGEGEEGDVKACLLLTSILDTLTKIFLYDTVGLISADRFNHILTPLTDQLENMVGGESGHNERVTTHLIPCLTKLAVAVGDDTLWRTLNKHILTRIHNDDQPQVSVVSIKGSPSSK